MRSLRLIAVLPWIAAVGCYSDGPAASTFPGPGTEPTADPRYVTGPGSIGTSHAAGGPGPGYVAGPPGGAMDANPAYGAPGPYADDAEDPNDSAGDAPGGVAEGPVAPAESVEPGAYHGPATGFEGAIDPNAAVVPGDPNAVAAVEPAPSSPTANVSDAEIDAALTGYGEWVQTDDYGEVWRPDATVVGQDFTPYESGGAWQDTDAGWTFSSEYTWGWLPFHYGRWAWFHDYWGWVPGHRWGPAWVEWRHGGGLTGWRPLGPGHSSFNSGRGYAHHGRGVISVEHRHAEQHEAHWRFANNRDFAQPHIRSHLSNNLAENLRVTARVNAPPIHGRVSLRTNDVMRNRFDYPARVGVGRPLRDQRQVTNPALRPVYPTVRPAYPTVRPANPAIGRAYRPSGGDAPAARGYVPRPQPTYQPGRAYPTNTRPTFTNAP
ncbi:MAG TPA: DUF6600 domain-containing protein, partial [Kofleriaceae bacterium]|nr:DUF6600 domain-containing protein [Kofleriaceae bacterium]